MKLDSIVDIITNSSSTTFIYPIDDAIEATKKMMQKFMKFMDAECDIDVHIEPKDSWYYRVFWLDMDIAEKFLATKNMTFSEFYNLEDQKDIINEFKIKTRQDFFDGKLDFDFSEADDYEFWPRYLDVIITNKKGESINLTNQVLAIYNPGEFFDG